MTTKLLPKVKRGTASSVEHSLNSCQTDSQNIKSELRDIKRENPVIADFIRNFCKLSEDKAGCALSGILVYKLLKSQSEADMMSDEIKLE